MRENYKIDKEKPPEEEWPPHQPSSIVNLALIHYNDSRTQQELIEISNRCQKGASHVDKLTALDSNVTTDVYKMFKAKDNSKVPKRILIEGAPGIGKTILTREIAHQWANGEILKEYKLVFLLFLRDPKLHEVKSVNEILKLFTSEITPDLQKYVAKSRGENVAFVFDGFDEYPSALRKECFITNLIKGDKMFYNSTVIVTSRPTATLFLHNIVDRRIEILGFPKEERDKYVSISLSNSQDEKRLYKYLKQHPIIDNLCYIPLHLAILIYLFRQDSLPRTLKEMNKSFIINTIYRYLDKNKLNPPGVVKNLEDFPENVYNFIDKLSQLAFKGLQNNQLVFTLDEIRKTCSEIDNIPGAINGFGLLQAVQHFPKEGAGQITSVNFLHFTMQEYLAALFVSGCSNSHQSNLMRNTFWDGQFNFMWMMYVGIVGVNSKDFINFMQNDNKRGMIYDDKRKCLHLFQCYMEARSETIPKRVSSVFIDGKIILNDVTLLPHHISSLIFFMSASSMQQWKVLEMQHCNLGNIGMNSLLEHVIKSEENMSTLEYVDLSGNKSSPWGVYCAIIKHCSVDSLTLCGDEGMTEYVKEIKDSLQTNTILQSLTLCNVKSTFTLLVIKDLLIFKELNLSWNSKNTQIICGKLTAITALHNVNNNIKSSSSECTGFIPLFDKEVKNVVLKLMSGLHTITSQKLIIRRNSITDDGAIVISDCLKYNNALRELDLAYNYISYGGMESLSKFIDHAVPLEYVDLSENKSSPWGVYCAIIRHCSVGSLTLCGDEGMIEYVKEITDNLQSNAKLHSLSLKKIGLNGLQSIKSVLNNNTTLKRLNLSRKYKGANIIRRKHKLFNKGSDLNSPGVMDINILYDSDYECSTELIKIKDISCDELRLIAFGLCCNTTVKVLDLSDGNIEVNGVIMIIDALKHNKTLRELNLSRNCINDTGMTNLSACIKHPMPLQYVDLSGNESSPWGVYCAIIRYCSVDSLTLCGDKEMIKYVMKITDSLQSNAKLQSLSLYKIGHNGLQSIEGVLNNSTTLKRLNISSKNKGANVIYRKHTRGVVYINILYDSDYKCSPEVIKIKDISYDELCLLAFGLCYNTTVKVLDLSDGNIEDNGVIMIIDAFEHSKTLRELNLSRNCIDVTGMTNLSAWIKHPMPLQYVDLSGNKSSPWGVYCAIIRYCSVDNLTLCGDERMNDFVKAITESLQSNTKLQLMSLYQIGHNGLQSIKYVLNNSATLKRLNVSRKYKGTNVIHRKHKFCNQGSGSHLNNQAVMDINILYDSDYKCSPEVIKIKDISYDELCLIAFGLCYNTTVKVLDLSDGNIEDNGVIMIIDALEHSKTLRELNLSRNCINVTGMTNLSACIKHPMPLQYVDLSGNESSPWGVYCAIIKHCSVDSLTLCGDEGMMEYAKEIIHSLQTNTTLQLLTFCASKVGRYEDMIINERSHSSLAIYGKLYFKVPSNNDGNAMLLDGDNRLVNVKVLYDGDNNECLPGTINLSRIGINDDTVCLMSFGLYNNATIRKLDLSFNRITDKGIFAICDCFRKNFFLHTLILTNNIISHEGAKMISEIIVNKVQKFDFSQNNICDEGAKAISECLKTNNTLQELNLSDNSITSEGAKKVAEAIKVNKGLLKLAFSQNAICDDGVMSISESLKHNDVLLELDLSKSRITNEGLIYIAKALQVNVKLQKLDLSSNDISDAGIIANYLADNNALIELDLSDNCINKKQLKIIDDTITKRKKDSENNEDDHFENFELP